MISPSIVRLLWPVAEQGESSSLVVVGLCCKPCGVVGVCGIVAILGVVSASMPFFYEHDTCPKVYL